MTLAVMLVLGLAAGGEKLDGNDDVKHAYQSLLAQTTRDADAQVRLALWCERHGLTTERLEHLARALIANPTHTTARALLGQVRTGERWLNADELARKIQTDAERAALIAEYNAKRAEALPTAAAQYALALWCEAKGLKPESVAHLMTVVRLDPGHEAAWRRLGCKKHNGRWLSVAQINAEEAERKAQDKANRLWMVKLGRRGGEIANPRKRDEMEKAVADVTDPRAVPAIWSVFVPKGEAGQMLAVRLFGQIDSVGSSQALCTLTVLGATPEIRRSAAENLRQRDRREFLDLLISVVRRPLRYELRPNPQTNAMELYVEGVAYDAKRSYRYPTLPEEPERFFDSYAFGPLGLANTPFAISAIRQALNAYPVEPGVGRALQQAIANPASAPSLLDAAARSARATPSTGSLSPAQGSQLALGTDANMQRLSDQLNLARAENAARENMRRYQRAVDEIESSIAHDVAQIEATNTTYKQLNDRVLPVLSDLTGQDFGPNPEGWARWWIDHLGYAYRTTPKPLIESEVRTTNPVFNPLLSTSCSCFAAGTTIHSIEGLKPIETIAIGDLVLTQDVTTGSLRFQPVVAAWHNSPDMTYRVQIDDETIVSTGIHRFWVAGRGWVMARDLQPSDLVRTRAGVGRVRSVVKASITPVFNLEVADMHSFFVGKAGALVHDYSLIEIVDRPFDAITIAPRD